MAYEYKIKVENLVNIIDKKTGQNSYYTEKNKTNEISKTNQKVGNDFSKALSAGFLLESSKKLLGSIQNESIQSFNMALGQTTKWGFLGIRAISGDPTAILNMGIELLAETIKGVQAQALKMASEKNSVDEARYSAGVLEINNVVVSKNWWDGRYTYGR